MFITYILSQFMTVFTGTYKSILQTYLITYSYIKIIIYAFIRTNIHSATMPPPIPQECLKLQ